MAAFSRKRKSPIWPAMFASSISNWFPELPSFTHSYYLLSAHPELSEVPGELWPDTYCPSNPESYKLLFDVYDEYIDLLKPRLVHAGHDRPVPTRRPLSALPR